MLENREIFKSAKFKSHCYWAQLFFASFNNPPPSSLILLEVFRLFFKFRNYVKKSSGHFYPKRNKNRASQSQSVNKTTKFSTLNDICEA